MGKNPLRDSIKRDYDAFVDTVKQTDGYLKAGTYETLEPEQPLTTDPYRNLSPEEIEEIKRDAVNKAYAEEMEKPWKSAETYETLEPEQPLTTDPYRDLSPEEIEEIKRDAVNKAYAEEMEKPWKSAETYEILEPEQHLTTDIEKLKSTDNGNVSSISQEDTIKAAFGQVESVVYDPTFEQIKQDHSAYLKNLPDSYDKFVEHAHGNEITDNVVVMSPPDEVNTGGTKDFDPYYWGQAEALKLTGDFTMPKSDRYSSIICADNGVAVLFHDSVSMSGVVEEGKIKYYALDMDGKLMEMKDQHSTDIIKAANKEYGNPESAFSQALKKEQEQKDVAMHYLQNNIMSR